MKITIFTLLVFFAFTVSALGQDKMPKWFDREYDKFEDKTTIDFAQSGRAILHVGFTFKGSTLLADQQEFYFYFQGGRCRGFCFNNAELTLLIDGERHSGGIDKRLGDNAIYLIGRPMIEEIANAKLVEYRVGSFEGKWETKALAKFKTLLELGTVQ